MKRMRKKKVLLGYEEDFLVDVESVSDEVKKEKITKKLKKKNDRPKVKCSHCGYGTRNAQHMRDHVINHHLLVKSMGCYLCSYKTASMKLLNLHKRKKHPMAITGSVHKCDLCECVVDTAAALLRHKSFFHQPQHPWTCSFCSFTTSSESDLHSHTAEGHGHTTNVYRCGFCGYSASMKGRVKVHIIRKHLRNMSIKMKRLESEKTPHVPSMSKPVVKV